MSKILFKSGEYEKMVHYDNIFMAYKNSIRNKRKQSSVLDFEINLINNLESLYKEFKTKTYKPGKYNKFVIYEPKKRVIESLPYRDRVAQHVLFDFLYPRYDKIMIDTSFANRIGRGTQQGMLLEQKYMRKLGKGHYIIKGDIHHFFQSIDQDILINILSKKIKDQDILDLCIKFIKCNNKHHVGIPIGNVTSQLFANIYLNELDHYVKDTLRVKYYIRYMDDFCINVKTKKEAIRVLDLINKFVNEKLNLKLNNKTQIIKESQGVNFLGGLVHYDYIKMRHKSVRNMKKKIKRFTNILINTGDSRYYNYELFPQYMSWKGLSMYSNCYTIRNYVYNQIKYLGIKNPDKYMKLAK